MSGIAIPLPLVQRRMEALVAEESWSAAWTDRAVSEHHGEHAARLLPTLS